MEGGPGGGGGGGGHVRTCPVHQVLRRMAERGEVDHVPILDDLTRCDVLLTYQGCGELYPNLTFRLGEEKDLD